MSFALKLVNVSKIYKRYHHPRERVLEALFPFWKRRTWSQIEALQNVHLEIQRGEAVGIVGMNGAGKSTLLSIILGNVHPTSGTVAKSASVTGVLSLGVGFHPDKSGKENLIDFFKMSGLCDERLDIAISKAESFSGIESHLQYPVKTYSSGMYARLAFAATVFSGSEILILDEVLSVGDILFQQKCIRKLRELQANGVTLLFVSHDVAKVMQFCNRAIWMHEGKILMDEKNVSKVLLEYVAFTFGKSFDPNFQPDSQFQHRSANSPLRFGTQEAKVVNSFLSRDLRALADDIAFEAGQSVYLRLEIESPSDLQEYEFGFNILNSDNLLVMGVSTGPIFGGKMTLKKGKNVLICTFQLNLVSGEYSLYLGITKNFLALDQIWPLKVFSVTSPYENSGYAFTAPQFYFERDTLSSESSV